MCCQIVISSVLWVANCLTLRTTGLDASFKSPSNRKPKHLIVAQQTSNEVKHNPALDQMKRVRE